MTRLLLPLLLSFTTLPALASEISFFAGRSPAGDLERDEQTVDFDSASFFGARFEQDFLIIIGWEHNVAIGRNLLQPETAVDGEEALYYVSNLVLNMPNGRWVPNLVVGIGAINRFGNSFPDAGLSFLTNWGGGLKIRGLAGPAGLRIDYRRLRVHGVEDESVLLHELSGGILLTF